jgi:hypothetical protein
MQVHADHIKAGVLYGYRTQGDYGDFSDGQGNVYYFGRTRQKDVLDFKCTSIAWTQEDKDVTRELLRKKCNRTGLNAPSRILLWKRVCDIEKGWDELRRALRTPYAPFSDDRASEPEPPTSITNHVALGDNYYTVEGIGPDTFGIWIREVVSKTVRSPTRVTDSFRAASAVRVYRIEIEV